MRKLHFALPLLLIFFLTIACNSKSEKKSSSTGSSNTSPQINPPSQGLQLTQLEVIADLPEIDMNTPISPQVSPDGLKLGWLKLGGESDSLCIYEFEQASQICHALDTRGLNYFYWSPDSKYIALHEEFFRFRHESDIWVFELETNTLTNLTEDGLQGNTVDEDTKFLADTYPQWNPATGDLYFQRTTPDKAAIYRIKAGDIPGESVNAEHIVDLPAPNDYIISIEGMSFSPDGRQLALTTFAPSADKLGIQLIDLEKKTISEFLSHQAIVNTGLPDWYIEAEISQSDDFSWIDWSADGSQIVVSVENFLYDQVAFTNTFRVNVATHEVKPFNDWSEMVDDRETWLTVREADGHAPFYDRPINSVWLRNFDTLIYQNSRTTIDSYGYSGFVTSQEQPIRLIDLDPDEFVYRDRWEIETVGYTENMVRVVSGAYLLTFEITPEIGLATTFDPMTEYHSVVDLAPDSDLQFIEITSLDTEKFDIARRMTFFAAPDQSVVYLSRNRSELCGYDLVSDEVTCNPWHDSFAGFPTSVQWSSSGEQFVYTEQFPNDGNIHLYDIATQTLTMLTNDENADYVPIWHPTDSMIYFFRNNGTQVSLNKVDPVGNNDPELMLNLPVLENNSIVYHGDSIELNGRAQFSPDGMQLVFIACENAENPLCYLYLLDMATQDLTMLTFADNLGGLAWSADGSTLFLVSNSPENFGQALYTFPITSGDTNKILADNFSYGVAYGNSVFGLQDDASDESLVHFVRISTDGEIANLLDIRPEDYASLRYFRDAQSSVIHEGDMLHFFMRGMVITFTQGE